METKDDGKKNARTSINAEQCDSSLYAALMHSAPVVSVSEVS